MPEAFLFDDDGAIPNSRLPLLVYRAAVPRDPAAIEALFNRNQWPPAWRDTVHPYHHFHSNTHEVLGVARGHATVQFGGPLGRVLRLMAGDVVVIPAGVGHRGLERSRDLMIVGAYPNDAPCPDQFRGNPAERAQVGVTLAAVPLPPADPVTGGEGPLTRRWGASIG